MSGQGDIHDSQKFIEKWILEIKENIMASEFKLPELGENIDSGTVAKVLVSEGDKIQKEQPLVELETDKAVLEVPSDSSGIVKNVLVSEGDEVKVGQTIVMFEDSDAQPVDETPAEQVEAEARQEPEEMITAKEGDKTQKEAGKKEQTEPSLQKKNASAPQKSREVEFIIPELGENIESGTVAKILVSKGDSVEKDQALLELETDKAVLEVPSEMSGTVKKILVKEGDTAKVGQSVLVLAITEEGGGEEPAPKAEGETPGGEPTKEEEKGQKPAPRSGKEPVERKPAEPATAASSATIGKPEIAGEAAPAAPSVRRFAREIGIDINQVSGSGPYGRISIEDVKSHSKRINRQRSASIGILKGVEAESLPDFSKWGEVERKPMSSVRSKTAKHLSYAWATIPHVTQHDKADITELEKLRKQYGKKAEAAGGKLTVTAVLLKIISAALKAFPQFNASVDMENSEVIYKKYYNIGVAVDTDRGLLVPVVRDVDKKNIIELAAELNDLAEKARNKKLSLEDMQGGNISISNLGGIGGTAFTPVVNSPEVAVLGVSRARMEPVYMNRNFEPRLMLPLSLSYDHRLIDGADAARFLRWVAEAVEQPFLIVLEG